MGYPVTYYCPRCERLVELEREGYLADKSVTPYPLEGWTYVSPEEDYERDDVDGVRFVCGTHGLGRDGGGAHAAADVEGCEEPFYLSFVRFEGGKEVDPHPESEFVEIATDPRRSGPRGPGGPRGPDAGGFGR